MGYTHYWYRKEILPADKFAKAVADFKKLIPHLEEAGIVLAGGRGEGGPVITQDKFWFNGLEKCGHERKDLGVTWPSKKAGGVSVGESAVDGRWFAGAKLASRTCDGDCSHETFYVPRVFDDEYKQRDQKGLLFAFCKTAYKPYDLAVTSALIVLKHNFSPRGFIIQSDGEDKDWFDAKLLCSKILDYGMTFKLDSGVRF